MYSLTNNIKAVSLIADKKDYRSSLQVINFTGKQAVATDGFILAMTDCNIPEQKRWCGDYQQIKKYDSVGKNGEIIKKQRLNDPESTIEPKKIDCDYPNYQTIIPDKDKNNYFSIGFSVAVLEKLLKSLKASNTQIFEMNFSSNPIEPAVIYSADKTIKYLVMPAKINN